MPNTRQRLTRCFAAVFPRLTTEEIELLGPKEFESWDSIDLVSLFAVISEEFGVGREDLVEKADTFDSMLEAIEEKA